jgi:hypothetical protein
MTTQAGTYDFLFITVYLIYVKNIFESIKIC